MLSLASILNPAPPGPAARSHLRSPPGSSSPEFPFLLAPSAPMARHSMAEKHRTPKDLLGYQKSKAKGTVKFYPSEDLDEESLREVRKFRVTPFGGIRNNCRHIPYNSGKKDFFEKTGRESFEVFQYTFKLPNEETEYTVMWDYNVGLVRMTPFFKCCNYPKTTPAKMLNMNPGLRDITHSITGGSIMAQGYWMPFSCARAVCATFCHHIAGALIPIFGPKFPSECVHPDAPDHGRMSIDPTVVAEATLEAEGFRRLYAEQAATSLPLSPRPPQQRRNNNLPDRTHSYQGRQRFRGGAVLDSPYGTDTEEMDGISGPEIGLRDVDIYHFDHGRYPYTPTSGFRAVHAAAPTSSGWTASNTHREHPRYQPSDRHVLQEPQPEDKHASPWLSAIPRLSNYTPHSSPSQPRYYLPAVPPGPRNTSQAQLSLAGPHSITSAAPPTPVMSPKRPRAAIESADTDHEYDGGESQIGSSPTTSRAGHEVRDGEEEYQLRRHQNHGRAELRLPPIGVSVASNIAERNAALLLMNLSVTDAPGGVGTKDNSQEEAADKTRGRMPWEAVRAGEMRGSGPCREDRPAKKRRRTISI